MHKSGRAYGVNGIVSPHEIYARGPMLRMGSSASRCVCRSSETMATANMLAGLDSGSVENSTFSCSIPHWPYLIIHRCLVPMAFPNKVHRGGAVVSQAPTHQTMNAPLPPLHNHGQNARPTGSLWLDNPASLHPSNTCLYLFEFLHLLLCRTACIRILVSLPLDRQEQGS